MMVYAGIKMRYMAIYIVQKEEDVHGSFLMKINDWIQVECLLKRIWIFFYYIQMKFLKM